MAAIEPKISKLGAAGTAKHITLTITETPEIVRKPEMLQSRVSLWQHTTLDCLPSMV